MGTRAGSGAPADPGTVFTVTLENTSFLSQAVGGKGAPLGGWEPDWLGRASAASLGCGGFPRSLTGRGKGSEQPLSLPAPAQSVQLPGLCPGPPRPPPATQPPRQVTHSPVPSPHAQLSRDNDKAGKHWVRDATGLSPERYRRQTSE